MDSWPRTREVEKIPVTQRARHLKLKAEALKQVERLRALEHALELTCGSDNRIGLAVVDTMALIDRLCAELRVPK